MLAYMKYENGLKFQNVVFENENAAKLWLKQHNVTNPDCYKLVEVEFVKEEPKALKKAELEDKLQEAREIMERFQQMCERYEDYEIGKDMVNEWAAKCEKIQKEIDSLEIEG